MKCKLCGNEISKRERRFYSLFRIGGKIVKPHWCIACDKQKPQAVETLLAGYGAREDQEN